MTKKLLLIAIIVAGFLIGYWGRTHFATDASVMKVNLDASASPERIISMAPSVTEVLFALEQGDKVVGVTRYCDYPPEALEKTAIGGFLDPNYEAVVALKPDLVVLLPIHTDAQLRMEQLGIRTLTVEHRTLDGILESITIIGDASGSRSEAESMLADIRTRMSHIEKITDNLPRPTILLSAGRGMGTGKLEEVYVAGKNQWYDEVITLAGGRNAFTDETIQFPALSGEGLYRLNPDVIIDMAPDLAGLGLTRQEVIREWDVMDKCSAVINNRVYVLDGDYTTIPGPRFIQVIEDVARVLHPDVDWDAP